MAASRESRTSLKCFCLGSGVCLLPVFTYFSFLIESLWDDHHVYIIGSYVIACNAVIAGLYIQNKDMYKNGVRAGFLGVCFGTGLLISMSDTSWVHFGWYITALAFFHWSEYYTTAVTNPKALSLESYLLDHSREYKLAALASWTEFTIEWFIFPSLKEIRFLSLIGVMLVIGGEFLRKVSMVTANTNFNHYVQHTKQADHSLVTHGVYRFFRHPAYVGWFYWSIGTQLVLCNPVCLAGYTAVSWRFFKERIFEEELYLLNFFGEEYIDYQRKVGTGLPFIKGFRAEV
ncbi:protein-S-isoprenylcysteine O-methyltransferase-like [Haliotis cracherodii]|uniref:protein-S-isoprenylcysteine O-methyltransferase-like n=1 Tax=Haliotis cracherodii TaxID=6455 RepID=UPI0039E7C62B